MGAFDDILTGNGAFAAGYRPVARSGMAARGLAILTCIDSRIAPLAMLGLHAGDAKILRNAGGRASDDALRSLVLATNLLGVRRIAVIAHTDCRMTTATQAELEEAIGGGIDYLTIDDVPATLAADVARIREHPLIPSGVAVEGFVYDVVSGVLQPA